MDNKETYSKIAGVTHRNPEGTSRQELLRQCEPGQELLLVREVANPHDPNAVAVCLPDGRQLGYVTANLAETVAPVLDANRRVIARIVEITGQDPIGANIQVRWETASDVGESEGSGTSRTSHEAYHVPATDIDLEALYNIDIDPDKKGPPPVVFDSDDDDNVRPRRRLGMDPGTAFQIQQAGCSLTACGCLLLIFAIFMLFVLGAAL